MPPPPFPQPSPPERPPEGSPALLLVVDPSGEPDEERSPVASVAGGRLVLRAGAPAATTGVPFAPVSFRDVVIDAVVALERGGPGDACGLYFRQAAEQAYLAFVVTPEGRGAIMAVEDGAVRSLAEGALPPDAPFAPGIGAVNRLTVITAGPCVTCVVNGFVLAGVIVEPRFKSGIAGAVLLHGGTDPDARMSLRWAQVRSILVDEG
jgi:hypothetical protein